MSTGWPAGMMQDDCRQLSKWLASKPNAKQEARIAAQDIMDSKIGALTATIKELKAENVRAWGEYNEARAIAAKNHLKVLDYIGQLKVIEAENERLKSQLKGSKT